MWSGHRKPEHSRRRDCVLVGLAVSTSVSRGGGAPKRRQAIKLTDCILCSLCLLLRLSDLFKPRVNHVCAFPTNQGCAHALQPEFGSICLLECSFPFSPVPFFLPSFIPRGFEAVSFPRFILSRLLFVVLGNSSLFISIFFRFTFQNL